MVKFNLEIIAELENLKHLFIDPDPETRFYVKLRCSNCQYTSDTVYFDGSLQETPNGQQANFVAKCKECKREISLSIVPNSYRPYVFNAEENPRFSPVVQLEARGAEPIQYEVCGGGWNTMALRSGETFHDIDFEEPAPGDGFTWCDFDAESKDTVAITGLKTRFVKVTGS